MHFVFQRHETLIACAKAASECEAFLVCSGSPSRAPRLQVLLEFMCLKRVAPGLETWVFITSKMSRNRSLLLLFLIVHHKSYHLNGWDLAIIMGAFHKFMFGTGRFLAYYPCIFWAIRAVSLFRTICKHPLPANMPHRREIYISQGISAVLVSTVFLPKNISTPICFSTRLLTASKSVFLTLWMLPTGIWVICGSTKRKGSWLIVYCIVDLGLTVLMIASLIW
jgi:hypothetical protein